jgi:hypothetical protein
MLNKKINLAIALSFCALACGMEGQGDSAESSQARAMSDMTNTGGSQQERTPVIIIDEHVPVPIDPELLSFMNSLDDTEAISSESDFQTFNPVMIHLLTREGEMIADQIREGIRLASRDSDITNLLAEERVMVEWPGFGNISSLRTSSILENKNEDRNLQVDFNRALLLALRMLERNCIALMKACWSGDTATIEMLLDNGAEVNCREPQFGWTPLMMAAKKGDLKSVILLISKGADIHAKNKQGQTAAVMTRSSEILELLQFTTDFLKSHQS